MAIPKKAAVKKVVAKKTPAKKAVAKKAAAKKTTNNKPAIKKGSKLACQVCGFAITVDRVCGCVEEAHLICCDTPMHHKTVTAKKK